MSQGAQVLDVKYDTGKDRFFIADNDDIPAGSIVTAKTNSVSGGLISSAGGVYVNWSNSALAFPFDSDGIDAAIARIVASGVPGVVVYAATAYTVTRDHFLVSGISHMGTPMVKVVTGDVPDFWTVGSGTVLNLASGVTGLKWNNVDKGTEEPNIMDFALRGVYIHGLCFVGGLRGIHVGAYNAMGAIDFKITDVATFDCTGDFHIDVSNVQFYWFDRIHTRTTLTSGGGFRLGQGLSSALLTGDGHLGEIFCRCTDERSYGVVIDNYGPNGASLNDICVTGRIHSSRYRAGTPSTASFAFTSGSADVTVANAAEYAYMVVGMPVVLATAPTGFATDIVYFVVWRDGVDKIRLQEARYQATTGLAAGSTATVQAKYSGFPTFMVRTRDTSCTVKNSNFGNLACEVSGNVLSVLFENVRNSKAHLNNPSTSATNTGYIFRACEMGVTYAGASNITRDASGLAGSVRMINLAGGPLQISSAGARTLDSADNARAIRYSAATDSTWTCPKCPPYGFEMTVTTTGAGNVLFQEVAGSAIFVKVGKKTNGANSTVTLRNISPTTYSLTGDLQA